jgi:hypothetical protein
LLLCRIDLELWTTKGSCSATCPPSKHQFAAQPKLALIVLLLLLLLLFMQD